MLSILKGNFTRVAVELNKFEMTLTQFYKGSGSGKPIFKKYGRIFYDQTNMGIIVANLQGNRLWAGASATKALITIVGSKAFLGASTSMCIFNINKNIVFEGAGSDNPLYTVIGNRLYEGASTAKILMNWTGHPLTNNYLLSAIMIMRTRY